MGRLALALGLAALLGGCASHADRYDPAYVSSRIEERTGFGAAVGSDPEAGPFPGTVNVEDGVSEDEAVAIALWNNAAFREALSSLGVKRAALVQAGLLGNPVLSILFPVGPKQLEFALKLPLEAIWLQPKRVAAAEFDCEQDAALLVRSGLETVFLARAACADLRFAREQARLAERIARIHGDILAIAEARLAAGDTSVLDVETARLSALRAAADARRLSRDVERAADALAGVLGLSERTDLPEFTVEAPPVAAIREEPRELIRRALAARPDLRAAEMGVEAAGERAGLARWQFLQITAILDANGEGDKGFEAGPGLDVVLPVLDWGQGRRALASAEIEQAARRYVTVRDRIAQDVRQARIQYLQAVEELEDWRTRILPAYESACKRTEEAYRTGDSSRLPVLQAQGRLLDGRLREARLVADGQKARALLERTVGARLDVDGAGPPSPRPGEG